MPQCPTHVKSNISNYTFYNIKYWTLYLKNSAIDTSAIDMSAIDMSAIDTSAIDTSAIDTSVINISAIDMSGIDTSAIDTNAIYKCKYRANNYLQSQIFLASGIANKQHRK